MNKERGLTIFEVLLSLMIIGMTSTVVMVSIQNYNKYQHEITYRQAYYDEYTKLYEIFVLVNSKHLPKQELRCLDNKWEIYLNDELTLWFDNTTACYPIHNVTLILENMKITKLYVENYYLYISVTSKYGEDYLIVRWNNG